MTGPGAFWYNGAAAQVLAGAGAITGTAALNVTQPAIAASGTYTAPPITGTAALSVTQPAIAGSGTFTAPPITGTAALSVTQPAIAASGTVSVPPITGTAVLTVPQPQINASGTIPVTTPPSGGGRPHGRKRAVVHRYPERRSRLPSVEIGVEEVSVSVGEASLSVKPPRIRATGMVTTVEEMYEERAFLSLVDDDEDLALALTLADSWMT